MDVFSVKKRSEVMARIRSKGNRSTEEKLRVLLLEHKVHGWRRNYTILGKPDFAFPKLKIAVFVDGGFWHGHRSEKMPDTNRKFWTEKIEQNQKRDRIVNRELRQMGWSVLRLWDFELQKQPTRCIGRVKRLISLKEKGTVPSSQ